MVIKVVEFLSGRYNCKDFCLRINIPKENYWILRIGVMGRCQKLDIILGYKVIWKLMLSKNVNDKECALLMKKIEKDSDGFIHKKLTLKSQINACFDTFPLHTFNNFL